MRAIALLALIAACAQAQTPQLGNLEIRGRLDATQAVSSAPARLVTSLPVLCVAGQTVFLTTAPLTEWLHICTSSNTWTKQTTIPTWNVITGKPTVFPPEGHSHASADVTGLQAALDGKEPSIAAGATNQVWLGSKTWGSVFWADVAGKPSTFPPEVHNHDAAYVLLLGSYSNPSWLTGLAGAKIAGAVPEALALAGNGANCPEGQASRGVDAQGNAEGCFTHATGGSVTSVGLGAPQDEFYVVGSPITSSGTISLQWQNQGAFMVFAGPPVPGQNRPYFRHLVPDDIPTLPGGKITTAVPQAQALAAKGTDCPLGEAARGVDAEGNASGCFTPAGGGAGNVTGPPSSAVGEIAIFADPTGKVLGRSYGTGVATLDNGVLGTGSRSGNTNEFGTVAGSKLTNKQVTFDDNGNLVASTFDVGEADAGGPQAPSFASKLFASASNTWVFPGTEHELGTCDVSYAAWENVAGVWRVIHEGIAECNPAEGVGQYDFSVRWSSQQAGRLTLVSGGAGGPAASRANEIFPVSAEAVVTITHGYGTRAVLAAVLDSDYRLVEPDRVEAISGNEVRVTFAIPHTGFVILNRSGWSGDIFEGGGGSGDQTVAGNSGPGAQVLKSGTNVQARTLLGGGKTSVIQNENEIVISSTDSGLTEVQTSIGLLGSGTQGDPVRVNPATVPTFVTASQTMNNWGTIAAATCAQVAMGLPGATSNDAVIPRWPAAIPAGLVGMMFVNVADQVAVRVCNPTSSGIALPNGNVFGATILRSF